MPFSIATLNIWNRMGPWDERLVAIRTQLASLRPDVIALQAKVRLTRVDPALADYVLDLIEATRRHS